tara:strand:- start:102 stop:527 length:426 start_codon:yes stop_codon:yes gene_type:complete
MFFSSFSIQKPQIIALKIALVFSIIYSFVSIFSYLNIILTEQDFYKVYPIETILLLIGSLLLVSGNFLIFLLKKSGFWLSFLGTIMIFFINSSFDGIAFYQKFYGIEFQLFILFVMKLKMNGVSVWDTIYQKSNTIKSSIN